MGGVEYAAVVFCIPACVAYVMLFTSLSSPNVGLFWIKDKRKRTRRKAVDVWGAWLLVGAVLAALGVLLVFAHAFAD